MKEIINVGIGQAGVQIADSLINLYLAEHYLTQQGIKLQQTQTDFSQKDKIVAQRKHEHLASIFQENPKENCKARFLLVDTEPDCVNELFKSKISSVLNPNYVQCEKESANTYPRGYFSKNSGYGVKQVYRNLLRKVSENCDSLEAFVLSHGLEGGTGSGSVVAFMQQMGDMFPKALKTNFVVAYERGSMSQVVGPYNTAFGLTKIRDLSDLIFPIANGSLYSLAENKLDIQFPNYANLNSLISQLHSSYIVFNRFNDSTLACGLQDFKTNLILYPKINMAIPSLSPLFSQDIHTRFDEKYSPQVLLDQCYNRSCQFAYEFRMRTSEEYFLYGAQRQRANMVFNMSGVILARGEFDVDELARAGRKVKKCNYWVRDLPTAIKIGLTGHKMTRYHENQLESYMRNSVTAFRITEQPAKAFKFYDEYFGKLSNKKAFFHWYTSEGMEQEDFTQARAQLKVMQKDYQEIANQEPEQQRRG